MQIISKLIDITAFIDQDSIQGYSVSSMYAVLLLTS